MDMSENELMDLKVYIDEMREILLEFCDEKELCVANTWFKKNEERKITYISGGHRTEIDFVSRKK